MSAEQHEQSFGDSSRLPKISDRRFGQRSDSTQISSRAASLEAALRDNLILESHLESMIAGESTEQSLQRLLSIRSVVSTTSSFAERQLAAVGNNAQFREIGTGSIGKVFEHPGTVWAYKLPLTDDSSKLWNNYIMNRRIEESFEQLGPLAGQVEIPRAVWYAKSTTDDFWNQNLDRFPWSNEFPCRPRDVLCVERIFPLPKPTRDGLIELYCPPNGREMAKAHPANKDCLLRPILGRKRQSSGSKLNVFSLRNFKLHLDQIQKLNLDIHDLSFALADALAMLHWHTRIDAMDVEFVLGSSPQEDQKIRRTVPLDRLLNSNAPTSTFEYVTNSNANFSKRVTSLWLLDFDACSSITMDVEGVRMASKAFIETEAYYPRPNSMDPFGQQLWVDFGNRYIATTKKIVHERYHDLPILFMREVTNLLNRQTAPQPPPAVSVYQPRRGSGQRSRYQTRRGDPSNRRNLESYMPSGIVQDNPYLNFEDSGYTGSGRGDEGDTGSRRGSHGNTFGGFSRGRGDGGRGSSSHPSAGNERRFDQPWRG